LVDIPMGTGGRRVSESAHLPPLPPGIRTLSQVESERLEASSGQADLPRDWRQRCITCGTERTFRWWDASRTQILDYACPCRDQWVAYRYLLHAGIGEKFQRLSWADAGGIEDAAMKVL